MPLSNTKFVIFGIPEGENTVLIEYSFVELFFHKIVKIFQRNL